MHIEGLSSGWDSTPTEPASTTQDASEKTDKADRSCSFSMQGWRKKMLYVILGFLMLIIFVNLSLTLWILTVMRFTTEGIGPIRIVQGGIELSGKTFISDSLVTSSISSRSGQPISIESFKNFSITTKDSTGVVQNRMFIGRDRFYCQSKLFQIRDEKNQVLFSVSPEEILVGAESLAMDGEGGAVFEGSVQTPLVRADSGHELVLESRTRSLHVHAPTSINLESRAGGITANSLKDFKLVSLAGSIQLDASNVYLSRLETADVVNGNNEAVRRNKMRRNEVYQLCSCADGKLFLAASRGTCETYDSSYVCR